mmetsp:Transcript_3821/g.7309  ORF Transcript_3821/g.7309 Transcript_3821/m.7309 type:complete len:122 (+) Transcript_3821:804-1169(+)
MRVCAGGNPWTRWSFSFPVVQSRRRTGLTSNWKLLPISQGHFSFLPRLYILLCVVRMESGADVASFIENLKEANEDETKIMPLVKALRAQKDAATEAAFEFYAQRFNQSYATSNHDGSTLP